MKREAVIMLIGYYTVFACILLSGVHAGFGLLACALTAASCAWYFNLTFSAWSKPESDKDQ